MKITCNQFEGLLSFYLNNDLGENLTSMVEEHLKECPHCKMKYEVIHSIIDDIKDAYKQFIDGDEFVVARDDSGNVSPKDLSAYIDNELSDEHSVKIRRSIVARPKLREKVDKLYKLRKFMSDSFREQKSRLKTDFSKDIVRNTDKTLKTRQAYYHCIGFILFVIGVVCLSLVIVFRLA